jgi:hypothetical protein
MWHANLHAATAGDLFRIDPIARARGVKKCTPAAAKVCGKCTSGDTNACDDENILFRSFSNYAAFHYMHRGVKS